MSDIDEATGVPDPAQVESWLRTRTGFGDARVVALAPLTDGLSNVTCRVELSDAPLTAAAVRIQPTHGPCVVRLGDVPTGGRLDDLLDDRGATGLADDGTLELKMDGYGFRWFRILTSDQHTPP